MRVLVNIIKVFIIAVATIGAYSGYAQESTREAEAEWQRGIEAYSAKEYAVAKEAFERVEAMGYLSADLYYNLANTYLKLGEQHDKRYSEGELGRAILNYRRALKLDPTMDDARYNLDIVHDYTNDTEPIPHGVMGSMWLAMSGIMSSNGWSLTSILSLVSALVMIMFYLLSSLIALRKVAFFSSIALFFIFVLSTAFAISQRRAMGQSSEAVILCDDISSVHASPDNTSKVIRQPSQGVSVKILRTHGDWSEIEFVDGEKGWIPSKSVELV